MRPLRTFTVFAAFLSVALLPCLSYGSSESIRNNISVMTSTDGQHIIEADGEDGKSQSSSVRGRDGKSVTNVIRGEDGKDASVSIITGKTSSHVDIYTSINGEAIEDIHYQSDDGPIEETHSIDQNGAHVQTRVRLDSQASTTIVEPSDHIVSPITSQVRSRSKAVHSTSTPDATSVRDTHTVAPEAIVQQSIDHTSYTSSTPVTVLFVGITSRLHHFFSAITTYVSHIF